MIGHCACSTIKVIFISLIFFGLQWSESKATEICLLDAREPRASGLADCVAGGGICGSNVAITLSDAIGLQVNTGRAETPVDVHNYCRYIDNNGNKSHFVPFKTATEWNAFITAATSNPPPGISLTTCARPFSGQDSSQGLRFGPTSALPSMGDTGSTTANVSLPYWRTGEDWPTEGTSCSDATHTFSHSCYEEVAESHCWDWVSQTCTGSSCSGEGEEETCTDYSYDCSYCADSGSVCVQKWTSWTETFDFSATALNSDYSTPSWGSGESNRIGGSTRPDSQCTQRCTSDGHDCVCSNTPLSSVCNPTTETKTLACPSGQTGTHKQRRNYTCPVGTWGAWYDVTNTCKVANPEDSKPDPVKKYQNYVCGSDGAGTLKYITTKFVWVSLSSAGGWKGSWDTLIPCSVRPYGPAYNSKGVSYLDLPYGAFYR